MQTVQGVVACSASFIVPGMQAATRVRVRLDGALQLTRLFDRAVLVGNGGGIKALLQLETRAVLLPI